MKSRWNSVALKWGIFVLVALCVCFIATYDLTAYVYALFDLNPPLVLVQLVNSILGLLLMGTLMSGIMRVARTQGWTPERNVFAPIIDAIQRIARGDYSVRLDNMVHDHRPENHPVNVLAKSVNEMAQELNAMEKLRQEFISNVSHEIQSPLTSIRGFAQALENDQLSPDERAHYLKIIESESTRLSRITENLLRMASLESDQVRFERKSYRLDKQIRNLILACEPQWAEKNIDLQLALDEIEITADEDLLSQVWINLIHNAIKFTPSNGKICIDLHRQSDKVEFKIADTGIGISEQDQARVFERFFKADQSRTRSNGGSGLGLAIAKKIVEMHHGTIGVASKSSAGATFVVTLPAK